MKKLSVLLICLLCACSFDGASGPVATYGHWQVAAKSPRAQDGLCYAGTALLPTSTSLSGRTTPYLMVTRRPSGKIEISTSAGAPYAKGSVVKLVIDDKPYRLFFKDTIAWAKDDEMDRSIIAALKKATTIDVLSTIVPNTKITDHYSADGFIDALHRVRELCP